MEQIYPNSNLALHMNLYDPHPRQGKFADDYLKTQYLRRAKGEEIGLIYGGGNQGGHFGTREAS
jgi:hypothetical protein